MSQKVKYKVPRLYKAATKVFKLIKTENRDLEQLTQEYDRKTNTKAIAGLVLKALNNEELLNKIIENSKILVEHPQGDPWLYRILITELLFGKKRLPVGSSPVQIVLSYGPTLKTELIKAQGKYTSKGNKIKFAGEGHDHSASESGEKHLGNKTVSHGPTLKTELNAQGKHIAKGNKFKSAREGYDYSASELRDLDNETAKLKMDENTNTDFCKSKTSTDIQPKKHKKSKKKTNDVETVDQETAELSMDDSTLIQSRKRKSSVQTLEEIHYDPKKSKKKKKNDQEIIVDQETTGVETLEDFHHKPKKSKKKKNFDQEIIVGEETAGVQTSDDFNHKPKKSKKKKNINLDMMPIMSEHQTENESVDYGD